MRNMSRLLRNNITMDIRDYSTTYFKNKPHDCILYSYDGEGFMIHKELLGQTEFMREILKSAKDRCCEKTVIICPCTKEELAQLVIFLYYGKLQLKDVFESFAVQEHLHKIFGYPESLNMEDQITSLLNNTMMSSIVDLAEGKIPNNSFEQVDTFIDTENANQADVSIKEDIMETTSEKMNNSSNNFDLSIDKVKGV